MRQYRLIILACSLVVPASRASAGPADGVRTFLAEHCVRCHGEDRQSGDVRLDDLPDPPAGGPADARWKAVRDQVRDGLMPPAKEPRPDPAAARTLVADVTVHAELPAARLPNEGNLIPHDLLFGTPAAAGGASPDRVWRVSPDGYKGYVRHLARKDQLPGLTAPFTLDADRGIRDYAGLYAIDEPSTESLLRNAAVIVDAQCGVSGRNDTVREFVALVQTEDPTPGQIEAAIHLQFRMALGRNAAADELPRYAGLYEKLKAAGDTPGAVKTMLQAVILRTDALYRSEFVPATPGGPPGRRMLAPLDLAKALSLAVGNRHDAALFRAADQGELRTREAVAGQLRRVFADPKADRSRIPQFFREYFEYDKAEDVFKEKPKRFMYSAGNLVADTDLLVGHIVAEDKDVFRRLLTTNETFVNARPGKNKNRDAEVQRAQTPNAVNHKNQAPPEAMYGLTTWTKDQPVELPAGTRIGVLMQPSWLASWSTNFDTDPVRRGRWVRERLLGGTVPDLPIGVVAQVPDDPHRTYRDRLAVTRHESCWKCHRRMDDLGLPFEQFDHYGRFRTTEAVLDVEATARNVDEKGQPQGDVYAQAPLDTTGLIADTGDPALDGPVHDPRELVRKLADSDRCRQVFVRHAFRYFLGRNETLADARALQDADRAYVESGGSFTALVISLLTSDPFLFRTAPKADPQAAPDADPGDDR